MSKIILPSQYLGKLDSYSNIDLPPELKKKYNFVTPCNLFYGNDKTIVINHKTRKLECNGFTKEFFERIRINGPLYFSSNAFLKDLDHWSFEHYEGNDLTIESTANQKDADTLYNHTLKFDYTGDNVGPNHNKLEKIKLIGQSVSGIFSRASNLKEVSVISPNILDLQFTEINNLEKIDISKTKVITLSNEVLDLVQGDCSTVNPTRDWDVPDQCQVILDKDLTIAGKFFIATTGLECPISNDIPTKVIIKPTKVSEFLKIDDNNKTITTTVKELKNVCNNLILNTLQQAIAKVPTFINKNKTLDKKNKSRSR